MTPVRSHISDVPTNYLVRQHSMQKISREAYNTETQTPTRLRGNQRQHTDSNKR